MWSARSCVICSEATEESTLTFTHTCCPADDAVSSAGCSASPCACQAAHEQPHRWPGGRAGSLGRQPCAVALPTACRQSSQRPNPGSMRTKQPAQAHFDGGAGLQPGHILGVGQGPGVGLRQRPAQERDHLAAVASAGDQRGGRVVCVCVCVCVCARPRARLWAWLGVWVVWQRCEARGPPAQHMLAAPHGEAQRCSVQDTVGALTAC